jgi:hypothetical protein
MTARRSSGRLRGRERDPDAAGVLQRDQDVGLRSAPHHQLGRAAANLAPAGRRAAS